MKINAITLNSAADSGGPLSQRTIARTGAVFSFRAFPGEVTLDGSACSAMLDRVGASTLVQAAGARQPSWQPTAILDQLPGLSFDGGDWLTLSPRPALTSAFSFVCIFKPPASIPAEQRMFGNRTGSGQETYMSLLTTGLVRWCHGNGIVTQAFQADAWNIAIGASDGTKAKLSVNGGPVQSVATNNSASTNGMVLGAGTGFPVSPYSGQIKLWDCFAADLFADAYGLETAYLYNLMAANNYGVDLVA